MDPIVIIIVTLTVVAGGGASGAALAAYRYRRRKAMREFVQRKHVVGDESVSLFDVFWDLGASDLALEMMRHEGLLPEEPGDTDSVRVTLEGLVDAHGDYPTYVRETLEVIEEFEEARDQGGSRRNIPALKTRAKKLLAVDGDPDSEESLDFGALVSTDAEREDSGGNRRGPSVGDSFERRVAYRQSESASDFRVRQSRRGASELIDVDDLDGMSVHDLLGSVFEGELTETLRDWWDRRKIRGMKSDLDEAFEELYDFYVEETQRRPNFYDDLFATADRWNEEVARIEDLRKREPLSGEPTQLAADVLLEIASGTAARIARNAEANTRQTIEQIHAYAARGDFSMAGYLVYLNRNAFFAGRSAEYGSYVQRIENLAHRLQQELRELE